MLLSVIIQLSISSSLLVTRIIESYQIIWHCCITHTAPILIGVATASQASTNLSSLADMNMQRLETLPQHLNFLALQDQSCRNADYGYKNDESHDDESHDDESHDDESHDDEHHHDEHHHDKYQNDEHHHDKYQDDKYQDDECKGDDCECGYCQHCSMTRGDFSRHGLPSFTSRRSTYADGPYFNVISHFFFDPFLDVRGAWVTLCKWVFALAPFSLLRLSSLAIIRVTMLRHYTRWFIVRFLSLWILVSQWTWDYTYEHPWTGQQLYVNPRDLVLDATFFPSVYTTSPSPQIRSEHSDPNRNVSPSRLPSANDCLQEDLSNHSVSLSSKCLDLPHGHKEAQLNFPDLQNQVASAALHPQPAERTLQSDNFISLQAGLAVSNNLLEPISPPSASSTTDDITVTGSIDLISYAHPASNVTSKRNTSSTFDQSPSLSQPASGTVGLPTISSRSPPQKPQPTHQCPTCTKSFLHRHDLNKHVKTHNRSFLCAIVDCKSHGFYRQQDLDRHTASCHRDAPRTTLTKSYCTVLTCEYATKGFARKDNWLRHMRLRHGE